MPRPLSDDPAEWAAWVRSDDLPLPTATADALARVLDIADVCRQVLRGCAADNYFSYYEIPERISSEADRWWVIVDGKAGPFKDAEIELLAVAMEGAQS